MKLIDPYIVIFFNFSPTSNHLHPLQVENCDSNSRLVVDEDDNGKPRLERVMWVKFKKRYNFAGKGLDQCQRRWDNIEPAPTEHLTGGTTLFGHANSSK